MAKFSTSQFLRPSLGDSEPHFPPVESPPEFAQAKFGVAPRVSSVHHPEVSEDWFLLIKKVSVKDRP